MANCGGANDPKGKTSGSFNESSELASEAGADPNNRTVTGTEQTFTPIEIKKESDGGDERAFSSFEVQIGDGASGGIYGASHLGATRKELDPYFSTLAGGTSSDFIENCDYSIAMNNGPLRTDLGGDAEGNQETSDLSLNKVDRSKVDTVLVSHFRGPMIVSGWGTDHGDRPVPYAGDSVFSANPALKNDRSTWKSGPVDLKWDYSRKVWSMGHHMIAGIARGAITAPTTPCNPTFFSIKVLRNINESTPTNLNWELSETAIITNRDPSLQQEEVKDLVWVVAARINYEWLPVWVGCPDPCDDPDTEETETCPDVPCASGGGDPPEEVTPPGQGGGMTPPEGCTIADPTNPCDYSADPAEAEFFPYGGWNLEICKQAADKHPDGCATYWWIEQQNEIFSNDWCNQNPDQCEGT